MKIIADFHSHTCYGDGRHTPEEMVEAACRMGLQDYGISEHGFLDHYLGGTFGMDDGAFSRYLEELRELKERYRGRIHLHIGVEQDGMGPVQKAEYTTGSTHQLQKDGEYVMLDETEELLQDAVDRLWKGDWYAMTADYYARESRIHQLTGCEIVGHFDLVTKFNQDGKLFDMGSADYLGPALDAMRRLNGEDVYFEINTGAISRGYRREPYPDFRLLRELKLMAGRIMINSDSHSTGGLGCGFHQAWKLAAECGFDGYYILAPEGGFRKIVF